MTLVISSMTLLTAVALGLRGREPERERPAQPPTRDCVASDRIWPIDRRPIPVCWEAERVPQPTDQKCRCADGTQTEAPCQPAICSRVCATRGGMACVGTSDKLIVCDGLSEADCRRRRELVRAAVAETWEKNSLVRFTGWFPCAPSSTGIRIQVAKGRSRSAVGIDLDGKRNGMVLDLYRSDREISLTATHEFGHALGFRHEQRRGDTPAWCKQHDNDLWLGCGESVSPWDASSVMNYCNPSWNGNGQLSSADIDMVRRHYGAPGSTLACPAGLSPCGNKCVNSSTDAQHCGACNAPCGANHACVSGKCTDCRCPADFCGTTKCGNKCSCARGSDCRADKCVARPDCDCDAIEIGIAALQEELGSAPPNRKAALVAQIRKLQKKRSSCGC
jgi:hypothetical protein